MARPKIATVSYFPHYAHHGKTLFILEQHYGNDGYAFFYKLLEMLADSEGHFYDCRNATAWEFLQAKTRVSEIISVEILDKLSVMGVIDPELWKMRVIWMETFVHSVKDVYANRRVSIPKKPDAERFLQVETQSTGGTDGVSTDGNPQSKVKQSKVKNIKTFLSDSIEIGLAQHLFSLIKENNPGAKEPNFQEWARSIDLMLRVDKRQADNIKAIMTWAQHDEFWQRNILSAEKLRKQYDQLWLKMGGERGGRSSGTAGSVNRSPQGVGDTSGGESEYPVDYTF